jgi:Tat protein translocase TatB subunit
VFNLGFGEIAVILVVALIFLGPKMLPEIASGLGKVIREFRKATADIRQDIELDDLIRKPLQELREAATLPPDELKRRDEARAVRRKLEEEEARKRQEEVKAKAAEQKQRDAEEKAKAIAKPAAKPIVVPPLAVPSLPTDAISAGGTMIASPPPSNDGQDATPMPELVSPPPALTQPRPSLPPPLPRPTLGKLKIPSAPADTIAERPSAVAKTQFMVPPAKPAGTVASADTAAKPEQQEHADKQDKKEG